MQRAEEKTSCVALFLRYVTGAVNVGDDLIYVYATDSRDDGLQLWRIDLTKKTLNRVLRINSGNVGQMQGDVTMGPNRELILAMGRKSVNMNVESENDEKILICKLEGQDL